jgi:hypothetical protein
MNLGAGCFGCLWRVLDNTALFNALLIEPADQMLTVIPISAV